MTSVASIVARRCYHHASTALKSISTFTADDIPVVRQLVCTGHTDVAHHVALKMKTKEDRQLLFQDLYQSWDEELTASERFGLGCAVAKVSSFLSVTAVWPMLSAEVGTHWQLGNVAFASCTLALAVHWEQKRGDAESRAEYLDDAMVNVENIQGYFKDNVHACEMK